MLVHAAILVQSFVVLTHQLQDQQWCQPCPQGHSNSASKTAISIARLDLMTGLQCHGHPSCKHVKSQSRGEHDMQRHLESCFWAHEQLDNFHVLCTPGHIRIAHGVLETPCFIHLLGQAWDSWPVCMQGFLKVERQVVGWFKCEENHHFQQSLFPVFILLDDSSNG